MRRKDGKNMIKVTVWNEYRHEKNSEKVAKIYPNGLHAVIAEFLGANEDIECRLAALDDPDNGLPDEVLNDTDVLIWWGHMAHGEVPDALVDKIQNRILRGMGLIVLHSGHHSKIFKRMMGTSCNLKWRDGAKERLWNVNPGHPIAKGLPEHFELQVEEMYGEFFDIPTPMETIFLGWFNGGEVFRSGVTFERGLGRIFYFQPGHEGNPTFYDENIRKVITNAVRWVAPDEIIPELTCPETKPLENV